MPSSVAKEKDELEILFPGRVITVAGEELLITPFKLTQIPRVAAMCAKYYAMTPTGDINAEQMILKAGDDVWELMLLATGKDRPWLDTLSADDGVTLLAAIIEENADFFSKKLSPAMVALSDRVTAGVGGLSSRH